MYMYSLCEMMLDGAMSKLLILMLNLYLVTLSGNRFYCVRTKSSSNLTIINASFIRLSDKYYSCILIQTPNVYMPLGDCVEYVFFSTACLSVWLGQKNQIQIIHVRIHLQHKHQTRQLGYDEKHVAELDKKYWSRCRSWNQDKNKKYILQ